MAIGPIFGEALWEMSPPLFPSSCKRVEWTATTEEVRCGNSPGRDLLGPWSELFRRGARFPRKF